MLGLWTPVVYQEEAGQGSTEEDKDSVDEMLESSRSRKKFSLGDLGYDYINRYSCIIQTGSHQDDPTGTSHTSKAEQPQQNSVKHHRDVFPIVGNLALEAILGYAMFTQVLL